MSIEMKTLIKRMLKYDITIGIIFTLVLQYFVGLRLAFIFFIGLTIAIINFIASGFILEKSLSSRKWIIGIIFPMSYIIRIAIIILIALIFKNDFKQILFFIMGFIMHFPILIISWVKRQKGSD